MAGPDRADIASPFALGRVSHLQKPQGVTCMTRQIVPIRQICRHSLTNANLMIFGQRRTVRPLLTISLSSCRTRISGHSHSFSFAKCAYGATGISEGRYANIHVLSVDLPTPKSVTICARGDPLLSAIRTASTLKSSVCLIAIVVALSELIPLSDRNQTVTSPLRLLFWRCESFF